MKHFLLFYEVSSDYLERRPQFRSPQARMGGAGAGRDRRRRYACRSAGRRGADVPGRGPIGRRAFAQADPYVANGLVTRWYVREWTTVVGDLAVDPVRPD